MILSKFAYVKILPALLTLFLAAGCNITEEDIEIKEMWPLEKENSWNYQMEGGEEEHLTIEVTGVEQDQELGEYYQVEFDFGTHQTYEYYLYDDEGLLWFQMDNPWGSYKRVPPEHLIKKPPNETKTWHWQGELETITGSDLYYKGEGQIKQKGFMELDLPTGSYNALKIEKIMDLEMAGEKIGLKDIRYYVPGIGLVKQEVHENGHEQLNILIEDYKIQ